MNADDGAKMQQTYDGGTVSAVATGCALGCLSDTSKIKECVSDCVNTETGLSKPCSDCFGSLIDCTAKNCLGLCAGGPSDACTACQCGDNTASANCYADFATCTGIPDDNCTAP